MFLILGSKIDVITLRRTGAHRQRRPRYFRLAFTGSRTHFVVSSHQLSPDCHKKTTRKGWLFYGRGSKIDLRLKLGRCVNLFAFAKSAFFRPPRFPCQTHFFVSSHQLSLDCHKKTTRKGGLFYGRGSKIRTHDTRFWRPMLYQLSYTPNLLHLI